MTHAHHPLWLPRRRLLRLGLAAPAILALPRGARATVPTTWDSTNQSYLTTLTNSSLTSLNTQLIYTYASDFTNNKHWVHNNATGKWNDDVIANQNPATGTGGYSPAGLASGPFYPMILMQGASFNAFLMNFGAQTIAALPSGFSSANTAASATVTLDTSYNNQFTYSVGDCYATRAGAAGSQVIGRATHGFSSGKVCWEVRYMALTNLYGGWGNSSIANTSYMHASNTGVSGLGNWFYNNADSGVKAGGSTATMDPRTTFSTQKWGSGKLMWEATVNFGTVNAACGFANSSAALTAAPGASNSIAYTRTNAAAQITNDGSNTTGQDGVSNGAKMGWYVDFGAQRAWYYVGTRYNSSATADPATNTGGYDISAIVSTGLFPIMGAGMDGSAAAGETSIVGNFAGSFTVPVPSGFVAWDLGSNAGGRSRGIILP